MNDRDQRRYDRLTRVQTFGRDNAADFPADSKARTHFTNIDGFISRLEQAKAGQTSARVSKQTLLDALALDLQNIARTARAIELNEAGFAAPYRLPDSLTERALTTHADAVLQLLEDQTGESAAAKKARGTLRERFIAYELPEDFVDDLRGHFAVDPQRTQARMPAGQFSKRLASTAAAAPRFNLCARGLQ